MSLTVSVVGVGAAVLRGERWWACVGERKRAPSLSGATPGRLAVGAGRSGGRRLAGALRETSEGVGVADGDVGEHLAVELDAGEREAVHELRVAHAVLARGGVDAGDPQAAEVALAVAPVAVGVGVRLQQRLLRATVVGVRLAAKALGELERRAPLLARVQGALDARHPRSPPVGAPLARRARAPARLALLPLSSRLTRGVSSSARIAWVPSWRLCLGDFFSRMWLVNA